MANESECPESDDGFHCSDFPDGYECCACGRLAEIRR